MKWTDLHKTQHDDDPEREDDEDMELDNGKDPKMIFRAVGHKGGTNRIRTMQNQPIVALQNEEGAVEIHNFTQVFNQLQEETSDKLKNKMSGKPYLVQFFKNNTEGFALNWNPNSKGMFAAGQCDGSIQIFRADGANAGYWLQDPQPYTFHQDSVEDIEFSPVDDFEFASVSADGTLRLTDLREKSYQKCHTTIKAHEMDVNVLSWNAKVPTLIVTGSDDGSFKVWDKRFLETSISDVAWHTEPITSIRFQPNEDSTVAVSSADNRLSIWDFSVEPTQDEEDKEYPDQIMFLHQGQDDIKEIM